jgi:mRNA interferase MazF
MASSDNTHNPAIPKRGEVWRVNLDPTVGAEIKKIRPVVVINSDAVGKLPIKLVVPLTEWKDAFEENIWHVKVDATPSTGLTKTSAADTLQMRSVSTERFQEKIGSLSADVLEDISTAIAAVVEYE